MMVHVPETPLARLQHSRSPASSQARRGESACKSHLFKAALATRGIGHKRTRPCTPRTNGKAERFIGRPNRCHASMAVQLQYTTTSRRPRRKASNPKACGHRP